MNKSNEKEIKVFIFIKIPKGGGGNSFINSILPLKLKNINLQIFAYELDKAILSSKLKKNIHFINTLTFENENFSFKKVSLFFINFYKTFKLLKNNKPNIVISTEIYSFLILSFINLTQKKKILIVPRFGYDINYYVKNKSNIILRIVIFKLLSVFLNQVHFAIFTSKKLSIQLKKNFKLKNIKTTILPNYTFYKEATYLAKQKINNYGLLFKENLIKIIAIGRFEAPKDFITIIKAVGLINKKNKNVHLFLIGNGSQKNDLVRLINKNKLNKVIHFLGWKKNVYPYLKRADIFIFSSKRDGFGYTIIEAMSQKLPIISTRTKYGPIEILNNGKFGLIVPLSDKMKMAHAIDLLIKDPLLRKKYAHLSFYKYKHNYSDNNINKYYQFLLSVLKK